MFILVRLIHKCKLHVNVSFNAMFKIKHDTFPVNGWFDIDLLYFIYGFAFLLCSFSYVTFLFCTQPTKFGWGLLLSPIPSAGPSVSPSVSLLTFVIQWFYFDTFVWSRCPRVLKLNRTFEVHIGEVCKVEVSVWLIKLSSNPCLDNTPRKIPPWKLPLFWLGNPQPPPLRW